VKFQVLTLFPDFFETPLSASILGRAAEKSLVDYDVVDIRDFATDKHRTTDDLPYGGGAGMLMKPEPLVAALEFARERQPDAPRVLMSPQGEPLTQASAQELADREEGLILVCGRYEGIDERVREGWIDREISIGDYVLSGGEPGALVVIDAITRLLPGVLGNAASIREESFAAGALEYPQYTRPRNFRGREVPEVLLSGNHQMIAEWRREKSMERTRRRRPDLLKDDLLDSELFDPEG
jgi:tRNA (guanine37-N1)-methyltransferase